MTIYPGETGEYSFLVPYAASTLSKAVVTFAQENNTKIEIITTDIEDAETEGKSIVTIEMTQMQSLKLKNGEMCYVQINLLTDNGDRIPSEPIGVHVGVQHYNKVLT